MPWEPIHKSSQNWAVPPNLLDYDQTYAAFSWETVRRDLDGLPGGRGLNMPMRRLTGMPMVHDATTWPCAGWARTAAYAISPTATSRNRVIALPMFWRLWGSPKASACSPWPGVFPPSTSQRLAR